MNPLELVSDLFASLRTQKVRAISTILGILWGTLSVVLLLAFGTSLRDHMRQQAKNLGDGISIVWPGTTTMPFDGYGEGRALRIEPAHVLGLEEAVPELDLICPEFSNWEVLRAGSNVFRVGVSGIYPQFQALRTLIPAEGSRLIHDADVRERRRVAVLGERLARNLFGNERAVGETFTLRGAPFLVVGVLRAKRQTSDYGGHDRDRAFLPATTHGEVFGRRTVSNFVFRAKSPALHEAATTGVYEALGRQLGFDPRDRDALGVWDTNEEQQMVATAFLGMNLIFGLAGAFTLIVGGIGVGNLMFVLVRQRTREIGIRMAVGARPAWILTEVLGQTALLVAIGGAAGFALSFVVAAGTNALGLENEIGHVVISPTVAGWTIGLLSLIALLAGYFPARRAARLDPVAALAD